MHFMQSSYRQNHWHETKKARDGKNCYYPLNPSAAAIWLVSSTQCVSVMELNFTPTEIFAPSGAASSFKLQTQC